jgi:hypothetical protein
MEEKSNIKKEMFKDFINANKDFIKNHIVVNGPDKEKNTIAENKNLKKDLRSLMNSFQESNKKKFNGQTFNKTDHYRIPIVCSFYKKYPKYWDVFTIGEMEFLGIFKNKYKDETLFKKVADDYLGYLNDNNKNNSLSHLKALIGSNSKPILTEVTKEKINKLATLAKSENYDIIEIKEEIAHICRDLQITGEFIAYCNRKN